MRICGDSSTVRRGEPPAQREGRSRAHDRIGRAEPRSLEARLQIRRLDDLLRLHAGGRAGRRPPGGLFSKTPTPLMRLIPDPSAVTREHKRSGDCLVIRQKPVHVAAGAADQAVARLRCPLQIEKGQKPAVELSVLLPERHRCRTRCSGAACRARCRFRARPCRTVPWLSSLGVRPASPDPPRR